MSVKNKAMGTPYGGVLYIILNGFGLFMFVGREGKLYTYTNVGLSALYQHCTLKDDISYLLPT